LCDTIGGDNRIRGTLLSRERRGQPFWPDAGDGYREVNTVTSTKTSPKTITTTITKTSPKTITTTKTDHDHENEPETDHEHDHDGDDGGGRKPVIREYIRAGRGLSRPVRI
jgi:hypothetical protein